MIPRQTVPTPNLGFTLLSQVWAPKGREGKSKDI